MNVKTKDISAGEFRFLVQIERPSYKSDGKGGQTTEWLLYAEFWCSITNRTGRELFGDGTTGRVRTYKQALFITWWRPDILATDRISFKDTKYNIKFVNNVEERNKYLMLVSESGVEQ